MENKCLIVDKDECVVRTEGAIAFVAGTIVAAAFAVPIINVLSSLQLALQGMPPKGA
ncbi:MAG: hypothetical protein O8C67_04965 [Candidatus Methanoperedens sp.]|nr:hypothetical protein [Candidatus Methanoperedens sp.]